MLSFRGAFLSIELFCLALRLCLRALLMAKLAPDGNPISLSVTGEPGGCSLLSLQLDLPVSLGTHWHLPDITQHLHFHMVKVLSRAS